MVNQFHHCWKEHEFAILPFQYNRCSVIFDINTEDTTVHTNCKPTTVACPINLNTSLIMCSAGAKKKLTSQTDGRWKCAVSSCQNSQEAFRDVGIGNCIVPSYNPLIFFSALCTFFLFSAPSKWNVFYCITEIWAHKLRLHAPFTMDIIKGSLLVDAFSNVFMSCSCFVDIVNIYGNKHIFIVIAFVRSRSKCAKAYVTMQRSMPNLTVHWGHTAFHYERMVAIQRSTTL